MLMKSYPKINKYNNKGSLGEIIGSKNFALNNLSWNSTGVTMNANKEFLKILLLSVNFDESL